MPASTLVDLVKVVSSTVGTGAITLGSAVAGYRGASALVDGATYSYSIQQGSDYEYGRGIYSAGTAVLTRGVIHSSNSDAPIAITSGTAVSMVLLAEDIQDQILAPLATTSTDASQMYALFEPSTSPNLADPNIVDPDLPSTSDQLWRLYSFLDGSLGTPSSGTLGAFGVLKKYPISSTRSASIYNAPAGSWIYLSGNPRLVLFRSDGTFFGILTSSQFTVNGGQTPTSLTPMVSSVEFSTPAGAGLIGINLQSTNHNNSNPLDVPGIAAIEDNLMLNAGLTPLPYEPPVDPSKPIVPGPAFDPPTYSDNDDVRIYYDGIQYVYARTRNNAAYDKVNRYRFGFVPEPAINNGLWDHDGERLISVNTPMENIVTAFNGSLFIRTNGGDENPPMQINGVFLGGAHKPLVRSTTIIGHGFVNADVGAIWNDGVRNRVLWRIEDSNTIQWIATNNGTVTSWSFSTAAISGTTLTHVSGGVATGTRTVTADGLIQTDIVYVRNRVGVIVLDDRAITGEGLYSGSRLVFRESYDIPNVARSVNYITATNGGNPVDPAVGAQILMATAFSLDWTGVTRCVYTPVDVEAYTATQYGGGQTQPPNQPSGSLTYAYVPRTKAFAQASINYDFEAGQNITGLALINFTPTLTYSDLTNPPNMIAYINKASGVPQFGLFQLVDDTIGQGKTSIRTGLQSAVLITTLLKSYVIAGDPTSAAGAGDLHEIVNCVGTFDASLDAALDWVFPFPRGNGYVYSARAPGALAAHWVPVDARLIGKAVIQTAGSSFGTVISSVVGDSGVLVNWSGRGEVQFSVGM